MMEVARFESNVPLAPLSTLGVGGRARWFVRASRLEEAREAHLWCEANGTPMLVLGGGSNLVISDDGWPGLVLQIAFAGLEFRDESGDIVVSAAAGEPWDGVVAAAVGRGLTGVECLSGIPGCVGGTPIQNVGAYGQEVGSIIESVTVFDRRSAEVGALEAAQCRFAYRTSRFKRDDVGRFVVCGVSLRLRRGSPTLVYPDVVRYLEQNGVAAPSVSDVRRAVLAIRRRKGMVFDGSDPDSRSVGSFFVNPVVTLEMCERISASAGTRAPRYTVDEGRVKVPAAWLIERSGFEKGDGDGRAGISTKHPLAIVNRGGATAREIVRLAARIKRGVMDRFGVLLEPEPVFVGFESDVDVEYVRSVK
jgi:UDP-N-acetylmuramate dehydrogenase